VADPRCIVTAPLAISRGLTFSDLATAVVADALVRRAWAVGRAAELIVPRLAGDLASQHAFERELAKEGHDRTTLPSSELEVRAVAFDEDRRLAAAEHFARLSVTADLGRESTTSPGTARAARTAFVRLYEEGAIEQADRVVATCPRCHTPVDAAATERAEVEGECLTVRLTTSAGEDLELRLLQPELLPGVVAIAVPASTDTSATVVVPIADRVVPLLVGSTIHAGPVPVVAAHDGEAHDLSVTYGLTPITVLDAEGAAVVAAGPLQGLGRYAARAAAKELLDAEGVLVRTEDATEEVWRCRCCGTVLVPQLGRHWFLKVTDLEVAAADAVRHGDVAFTPPDARDAFLAVAGTRREWCLSSRVVQGGVGIPAATCVECGKTTVDVDTPSSCGKCMGALVADDEQLDGRFLAAIWPIVLGGWPGRRRDATYPAEETLAVVAPADLAGWVLPALSLGLRLTGRPPLAGAVVHPWPSEEGWAAAADAAANEVDDARVLRLALVAGSTDLDAAAAAVSALDHAAAPGPETDPNLPAEAAEAASAGVAALDDGAPAQAAALLTSALSAGVPVEAAERIRALALPILGDR
jgi:valyl-tRNA synthetase